MNTVLRVYVGILLALVFLFFPGPGSAELHGTLTMTTNNVGRWFTKSNNNPALQSNVDYQHTSGLYLGSSVSTVNFDNKGQANAANVEIVPYLGWSHKLTGQWRLDAQWSRYLFDGKVFDLQSDYNEFYLFLHYKDLFSGRISISDDYYALGNPVLDYELTGRYPVTDSLEFAAGFGYSQTSAVLGSDYPYWNAGFTYFYKFLAFDLRYMDATETAINPATENRLHERYDPPLINASCVFSISLGF